MLRALKSSGVAAALITVNSLMWPISAALDLPNLGLHVFPDPSMHQYLYDNISVVTSRFSPQLPPYRLYLASASDYHERVSTENKTIFSDYKPEYVMDSFGAMTLWPPFQSD